MRPGRTYEAVVGKATIRSADGQMRYMIDGDLHEKSGDLEVCIGPKVKIVVGQVVSFEDLPASTADNKVVLRANNKGVVEISQQTANSTAGFQAIAKGKTRITVWDGKPSEKSATVLYYIIVKVKKAPVAG